jgi:GTP diphosphokinase / guanosine-3',5'-bis(diphosphate) 3'-diphosphatase
LGIQELRQVLPETYSPADLDLITRAFKFANEAHDGQIRVSGEPYINHSIAVATILAEMHVPPTVVAAGLLHDTVEDTHVTLNDIQRDFGAEIAKLVDGVTKLTHLPRVSRGDQMMEEMKLADDSQQAGELSTSDVDEADAEALYKSRRYDAVSETLRKTFLAMGEDVRVVLIKLADRLHNMRTLGYMPENKRKRIAQETLDIFAPLANRLGIWQMKWELEDLAFRYVKPEKYREIAQNLAERRTNREKEMQAIKDNLQKLLAKNGIRAEITARPKHIFSIYKKMERKGVPFDQVYDVRGVRIMVDDIQACYSTLGVIHTQWRPIPGEFDDYIAAPKDNFYQSLHTSVVFEDGQNLEIQIRTPDMHQNAELGIAAHWKYKEGSIRDEDYERRIVWFRSLMEWKQDVEDAREFVDSMKTDVFEDRVYVFTPRGDIIDLPAGSTPIDFAYHVHTDIGHRCRGAKVDGKLVSLEYVLSTGEKVEILTAKRGGPSRDWINPNLGLVKTQRAKAKIKQWFKKQAYEQNASQGKTILDKELRRLGLVDVNIDRMAREFDYRSVDDFYVAIGTGDLGIARVVRYLTLGREEEEQPFILQAKPGSTISGDTTVAVFGLRGLLTNFARCCNPAPGDEIIGYVTRGRGATIHRKDCPNILRVREHERLVRVSWGEPKVTFPIPVRIKAYDRNGLMKDVWNLITDEGINIVKVNVDTNRVSEAVLDLVLEVKDIVQLSRILDRLENVPNVIEAVRIRPG